jgi:hypothetical protein
VAELPATMIWAEETIKYDKAQFVAVCDVDSKRLWPMGKSTWNEY